MILNLNIVIIKTEIFNSLNFLSIKYSNSINRVIVIFNDNIFVTIKNKMSLNLFVLNNIYRDF